MTETGGACRTQIVLAIVLAIMLAIILANVGAGKNVKNGHRYKSLLSCRCASLGIFLTLNYYSDNATKYRSG